MTLYKYVGGRKGGDVEEDNDLVHGQRFKDIGGKDDAASIGVYEVTSDTVPTDKGLARLIRFHPRTT
jgi:hypothetical protein